jgi:hypothetical protein
MNTLEHGNILSHYFPSINVAIRLLPSSPSAAASALPSTAWLKVVLLQLSLLLPYCYNSYS